jgi:hypothetical protein
MDLLLHALTWMTTITAITVNKNEEEVDINQWKAEVDTDRIQSITK